MKVSLPILICFLCAFSLFSQKDLNLNFEELNGEKLPEKWFVPRGNSSGYSFTIDSLVKQEGKYSLQISRVGSDKSYAVCSNGIPAKYSAKSITLKGYVKTEGIKNGWAGLWLRVDGEGVPLQFDNMEERGLTGTNDWKEYSIKLKYPEGAKQIVFGVLTTGTGKVWVDHLSVLVDNTPIEKAQEKVITVSKAEADTAFSAGSGIHIESLTAQQVENLTVLGKVWGFLKYYHPNIAKGEFNMDAELFRVMPQVLSAKEEIQRAIVLLEWVKKFGPVPVCRFCKEPEKDKVHSLPDLEWINDEKLLTKALSDQLTEIKNNRNHEKHYYIELTPGVGNPVFKNEKAYANMVTPDAGYRVLSLFRYWNMIHYFFPYKYAIGEDWNKVLPEFLPKFVEGNDSLKYRLAELELITRIHDTHAGFYSSIVEEHWGNFISPAQVKFIEDKAVVTGFYDEEKSAESGLMIGDVILKVGQKNVEDIVKDYEPYSPASNRTVQLREISRFLLRAKQETVEVTVQREGKTIDLKIPLVNNSSVNQYKEFSGVTDTCFKFIGKDIAYFNLGKIKAKYLKTLMKNSEGTKGMIIDLRNYPSDFMVYEMDKYLLPKQTEFAKFTTGDPTYPGVFYMSAPVKNGRKNDDFYKGKIVILVNELTQSQAEYTTMALRTAPNATVVGSTTAGADGNISQIILPGGSRTIISGIGVFYPNGEPTQRVGIIPDIEVKPTLKGIKEGKDEVLEKAIELIRN
jgi:C-terminal processing protease CtpA/Prc